MTILIGVLFITLGTVIIFAGLGPEENNTYKFVLGAFLIAIGFVIGSTYDSTHIDNKTTNQAVIQNVCPYCHRPFIKQNTNENTQ